MYETFVESVSLLKSLEVRSDHAHKSPLTFFLPVIRLPLPPEQLSERMKIVDVLGARTFKDGERIITQVGCDIRWDIKRF